MDKVKIVEIYGPVIQGEGSLIGVPTIFVRTGACDFRCNWCDSMFAVDPKHKANWHTMTSNDIVENVCQTAGSNRDIVVTFSGGNPALQDLTETIRKLKDLGFKTACETQGTKVKAWFDDIDHLIFSPKPPSSGMMQDFPSTAEAIATYRPLVKIVVKDRDDLLYAAQYKIVCEQLGVDMVVQPCNHGGTEDADIEQMLNSYRWLADEVLKKQWYNVRVLPQWHAIVWGSERER